MPKVEVRTDAFLHQALADGIRVSGRSLTERRKPEIKFGPQFGQVSVAFGRTLVLGCLDANIVMPPAERPNEGSIQVSVNYSRATVDDMNDRASGSALSYLLERLLRGSRVVDPESLCLLSGRKVWALKLKLRVVVNDGNVNDACCLAMIGSLMHFRRKQTHQAGAEVLVEAEETAPLPLLHHPLFVSFTVIDPRVVRPGMLINTMSSKQPRQVLVLHDPDAAEESAGNAVLTIAVNPSGDICLINKNGGGPVDRRLLTDCLAHAVKSCKVMSQALTEALAQ